MLKRHLAILLIILAVLSLTVSSLCAQERGLSLQNDEAGNQLVPPTQEQTEAKKITAIEVKGNKNVSTNVILSKMKSHIGGPYLDNTINEDLKRLYLLGFFTDIKIDTQDHDGGVKLMVIVTERPIIEKIVFSGIERLTMKEDKIKGQLKSKESQYVDYPKLAEDVDILKKMYERIGFSDVKIDYSIDVNKETNKAKVEFNIIEGKRIKIKDIYIEGNTSFPDKRIIKLLKTKRAWLFNPGILKEEQLTEDLDRIKSFYQREGFADVTVDYSIKSDPKKPFLYITFNINEGKKYLVGNVTIEGNKDISQKDILGKLKTCVPGKVFSQDALREDINNIQGLYFDKGYIFAQVQETTSLNDQTGRTDINYKISENQIAYVDKVKIRGNIKTKDVVIRRELRIKPGDRFDGDKLRRSKERLQNLGFFEEVAYDTEDTEVANKKDLVVEVKEAKTGTFSFGGGYSTVDQLVGFVEIEQKNFDWRNFPYFTGAGQNLKLRASFGTVSSGYDLSFTEPWLFDYPVSFGFDAYRRVHKRESDVGYGYDQTITGGDVRFGKQFTEYITGNFTYRYDILKISNINEDATIDLKKEAGKNIISSTEYALTFDSRDNVFDTTKGNLVTGAAQWAGGPFAGDKDYWKLMGRASHYIPLLRNSCLELRGRIGVAKPYGDSDSVPIYERFFAGGAYTIRGYEERKVGPIDPSSKDPLGGEAMIIGNVEYTYPLFSFLKVAAFYDVGNVWAKMKDLGDGGYRSGVGLGVRIKTPIGPVMLDYGYPLNTEPGEEKKSRTGRLHFSMSQGF